MLTETQLADAISKVEQKFLPYQRQIIYDQTRFTAIPKAVRTGITYCQSYKSSKKRAFRHPSLPKTNELFASKTRTTALEYLRYHRAWAECWNNLIPGLIDLASWTTEVCRYPGGDVFILSSDPNAFRGMEGDVTLDEFAFHEQQDSLFATAQSRIQWLRDGQVTLLSSHSHPDTTFARIVKEWERKTDGLHSVHKVTLADAVGEGLAAKVWSHRVKDFKSRDALNAAFVAHIRSTCLSEEDFQREYCCEPAALSAMVRGEVFDRLALEVVPEDLDHSKRYGELFPGIDCGLVQDKTVCWVLERIYDKMGLPCYRTVAIKSIARTPFPVQHSMLVSNITHGDIARGLIDQGAQGRTLAEQVYDTAGRSIEPIGMGSKNKGEMAERLRAFAQSDRITFPKDRPDIRADILCVRRESTPKGNLTYEGRTNDSHGDAFWACALALHAAERERVSVSITRPDDIFEGQLVA
jgi:phage FluMu gp28-like protein